MKIIDIQSICNSMDSVDIQATIECGFTIERVSDMIRTYIQLQISLVSCTLSPSTHESLIQSNF